ncbi:MAG: hypothetical protein IJZ77_05550 [Bacilli bacterium]|nr:hypothetical protein [Bacilli bacterium]
MKKDTNVIIRINKEVKEKAQVIAEENGLSLSALINSYLVSLIKEKEKNTVHLSNKNNNQKYFDFFKSDELYDSIEKVYLVNIDNNYINFEIIYNEKITLNEQIKLKLRLEESLKCSVNLVDEDYEDKTLVYKK